MSAPVENISVRMLRPHLREIPQVFFPQRFGIRPMQHGEGPRWTEIQRDAERFFPIADDLFEKQFGGDLPATLQRCFFVVTDAGDAVGTISAWHPPEGEGMTADWGRIHWVAVRPAYQGRGLGKAALSYALTRMTQWHERAMLDTSTGRLPALRLYLDFGFLPDLTRPHAQEAWQMVRSVLDHPAL